MRKRDSPDQPRSKTTRVPSDTLIIQTKNNKSYRDVLKSLRHNARTAELGESIRKVKKARSGDVLVTIANKANRDTNTLIREIEETLGVDAKVR